MIRIADTSDLDAIVHLWKQCFPNGDEFDAYFFHKVFRYEQTVLLWEDHCLAAMLQVLPYHMRFGTQVLAVSYLYGVCTNPEFRRHGYAGALLNWTFEQDRAQGRAASILVPQEEWLFDFYQKFGYQSVFTLSENRAVDVAPQDDVAVRLCAECDIPKLNALYVRGTELYSCVVLRETKQWETQMHLFAALGEGVFGLFENQKARAYAFVWKEDDGLWAQEFMAEDEGSARRLCGALRDFYHGVPLRITMPGEKVRFGCAKFYDTQIQSPGYFNLMFN